MPSPTIAATNGTPMARHFSVERAIASAWPRSSACTPGKAPGVSTRVTTGRPEAVGQLHQPDRLAIALGPGHAEIVPETARRVVAFLVADDHDPAPAEPAEAADDRAVVGEIAVAGERHEILDQARDIILEMRPLRMAGDLRLLPGRKLGIGVAQQPLRRAPAGGRSPPRYWVRTRTRCRAARRSGLRARRSAFRNRERWPLRRRGLGRVRLRVNARPGCASGIGERMAAVDEIDQPARSRHGCRSGWSRCRHGRAASAPRADRRRPPANGWRRRGEARAG